MSDTEIKKLYVEGTEDLTSSAESGVNTSPVKTKTRMDKFKSVIWDSFDKTPEERKYIFKIDCWIMTYVCVSYFIKYLDSMNVANAYVSGMKEDLAFGGTQYNWLSTWYYIGYIIGQVPSQYAITKIRPSIWLPVNEILYGICVMCMAAAKNVKTLYGLRFLVGLFEGTAYVGIMTILSNFYQESELGKRTCIFQTSSSAAQMFSGYLQTGLYNGMDGKHGIAAWRWLFIFDGILTFPVAVVGFFAIPDEPFSSKARWFNDKDRAIAVRRAKESNRNTKPNITLKNFKDLVLDWPFWGFTVAFTAHVVGIRLYGYMNLWLKSDGGFSVDQINNYPTAGFGLQIVCTLLMAWTSDLLANRWAVIAFACIPPCIGSIILWVWPENNKSALFAGWYLLFMETGAGALFIAWISETLSSTAEQRYLLIGFVEVVSFAFTAAVPLYLYPADEAPHYAYAYPITFMFFGLEAVLAIVMGAIQIAERRGMIKNKHDYTVYEQEFNEEDTTPEKTVV